MANDGIKKFSCSTQNACVKEAFQDGSETVSRRSTAIYTKCDLHFGICESVRQLEWVTKINSRYKSNAGILAMVKDGYDVRMICSDTQMIQTIKLVHREMVDLHPTMHANRRIISAPVFALLSPSPLSEVLNIMVT